MVNLLLSLPGVDVNKPNDQGNTPLHMAVNGLVEFSKRTAGYDDGTRLEIMDLYLADDDEEFATREGHLGLVQILLAIDEVAVTTLNEEVLTLL